MDFAFDASNYANNISVCHIIVITNIYGRYKRRGDTVCTLYTSLLLDCWAAKTAHILASVSHGVACLGQIGWGGGPRVTL
jgi:hypothetical protein